MSKVLAYSNNGDISTIEIEDSNGDKYIVIFVGKDSNLNQNKECPCLYLMNEKSLILDLPNLDEETKDLSKIWGARLSHILYPYKNKVYTYTIEMEDDK